MNQFELDKLVEQGIWKKDLLAESESETLVQNINKYKYFLLDISYSKWSVSGNGTSDVTAISVEFPCKEQLYHRDYINNWSTQAGEYSLKGNFGDGTKINVTERIIPENGEYNGFFVTAIYGYRPTRKTIYIYKKPIRDTNTYLASSLDELLYTVDNKKIAVKKVGE